MAKLPHRISRQVSVCAWWLTREPPLRLHVTILAPLLQKTTLGKDSVACFLPQSTNLLALLCFASVISPVAINLFSSRIYTDTSSFSIKQPEYSRHLHSELSAFPAVNPPPCLPHKKSHQNWRRSPHSLLRGVRMHRWKSGMMSINSSSKNSRWPRPRRQQPRRPPATVTPMTLNVSPVSKCLMFLI